MKKYINLALAAVAVLTLSGCTEESAEEQTPTEDAVIYEATATISQTNNTITTWEITTNKNALPYGQLAALSNNSFYASERASFNCGAAGEPSCTAVQKITCEETGYTGTEYYFRCHLDDDTTNFAEFNVQDKDGFQLYTMSSGWESKTARDNGEYPDNFDTSGSIDYN